MDKLESEASSAGRGALEEEEEEVGRTSGEVTMLRREDSELLLSIAVSPSSASDTAAARARCAGGDDPWALVDVAVVCSGLVLVVVRSFVSLFCRRC